MYVIILILFHAFAGKAKESQCDSLFQGNVEDCTKVSGVIPNRTITTYCNDTSKETNGYGFCLNGTDTCNKQFKLSIFNQQLYAITMKNAVRDMISGCCGTCARCSVVSKIEDISKFSSAFVNSPDIIFPIVSKPSIVKLHGFYFVPSFNVPSSYYFTLRKSTNEIIWEIVTACLNLWPLFLVCLLLAFLSGVFVWLLEFRKNWDDFRHNFYHGLFDGFWWSFISMTTVGYGDKTPKSCLGRLYAVLWILLGITLCSIFTASLVTEIIKAKEVGDTEISGKKVGVLKYRLHDIAIVAAQGGVLYQSSIYKTMRGINELLLMLQNRSINGFLLDRNTFYHFTLFSAEKPKHFHIGERFRKMNLVQTKKFLKGEELQCGILIKSFRHYEYFKTFFVDYRIHHEACNSLRMNTKKKFVSETSNIFSTDGDLFRQIVLYSVTILGTVIAIGSLLEGWRYYKSYKEKNNMAVKKRLVKGPN